MIFIFLFAYTCQPLLLVLIFICIMKVQINQSFISNIMFALPTLFGMKWYEIVRNKNKPRIVRLSRTGLILGIISSSLALYNITCSFINYKKRGCIRSTGLFLLGDGLLGLVAVVKIPIVIVPLWTNYKKYRKLFEASAKVENILLTNNNNLAVSLTWKVILP